VKRTLHLLGGLAIASGCACAPVVRGTAKEASRTATPIVVDETLKTLEDERTRERIAAIVGSPEIQKTMGELASSLMRGTLDDPETTARIERVTAALTRTLIETVRAEMSSVTPEIRETVRRAVTAMVADATREVSLVLAEEIPGRLAPAVRSTVATQLEDPELRSALSSTTRAIAKEALIGSQQAMAEQTRSSREGQGVLGRASRLLKTVNVGFVFAMGAATIMLTAWLWRRRRNSAGRAHDSEAPIFL
jgi:hypothetical protein